MAPLDLPPVTDEPPAGPNLELDAVFGEMERAAQEKPESQYGNTIEPATPPDWKETAALAESLLQRTRDLRVMVPLALARLHLAGLPGYAEIVGLIRTHLETMWDALHPQLDPEDDNDPIQRANVLRMLQDPSRVLRPLRDLPLADAPRIGRVSWRDLAVMNGAAEPEAGRERQSETNVLAVFAGTDAAGLEALRAAADTLQQDLAAIPAAFDARASAGSGPDFTDLLKLVRDILQQVTRYQAIVSEAAAPEPEMEAETAEAAPVPGGAPAPRAAGRGASIQSIVALHSRPEALHALELAAAYFRSNEPSSPLPLLIDRAKRLAPLAFLDILRDLAPDGVQQAQIVVGRSSEDAAEG